MRASSWLAITAAAVVSSLSMQSAEAYCRTSVCETDAGTQCVPTQPGDCGLPLFWNRNCIGVSLQKDITQTLDNAAVRSVIQLSFSAWQTADCSPGNPGIRVQMDEDVECGEVEYNGEGGNANIIVFRDGGWPHAGSGNTLALTTVTYDIDSGEIYDADMEVNSTPAITLTVSDTEVQFDLQAILTHEAGHALGLAHSERQDATMWREYIPGDISIRNLSDDDVSAICVVYPPKTIDECDIEPRHGFKSTCGPGSGGDCGCGIVHAPTRHYDWATLMLLFGFAAVRRRGARKPNGQQAESTATERTPNE